MAITVTSGPAVSSGQVGSDGGSDTSASSNDGMGGIIIGAGGGVGVALVLVVVYFCIKRRRAKAKLCCEARVAV